MIFTKGMFVRKIMNKLTQCQANGVVYIVDTKDGKIKVQFIYKGILYTEFEYNPCKFYVSATEKEIIVFKKLRKLYGD